MKKVKLLKTGLFSAAIVTILGPSITALTSCSEFAQAKVLITLDNNEAIHDSSKEEVLATASIISGEKNFKNWEIKESPSWLSIDENGNIVAKPTTEYGSYTFYVVAKAKDLTDSNKAMLIINCGPISDDSVYYQYTKNYYFTSSAGFYAQALNNQISGDINIVSSFNGINTVAVKNFSSCNGITSVNLSENICEIDDYCFQNCNNLSSIILNDKLMYIFQQSFQRCTSLSSINIPSSVEQISYAAFDGCTNLSSVTFESDINIDSIPGLCFQGSNLTEITLPVTITGIGKQAFANCANFQSIKFQRFSTNWLKDVSEDAFEGCNNFKNILVPSQYLEQYKTALADYSWASGKNIQGY